MHRFSLCWRYSLDEENLTHTLILLWDGSAWSVVPSPSPGSSSSLASVSATATDDEWAAGYFLNADATAYETLVLHWDGTSWTEAPSLNTQFDSNFLDTIDAVSPDNVRVADSFYNDDAAAFQTQVE